MELDSEVKDKLEDIIDAFGLFAVLVAIGDVCNGKGAHIESNYQDTALAKQWYTASNAIRNLTDKKIVPLGLYTL